jgi:thymidylate synthase (FAD)
MGTDLSVVNAARVSFDKKSEWYYDSEKAEWDLFEKDEKLISYLAKHNHWSPFAHTTISLRIKSPIFVARQLVKHQVGLAWNEVSRRYVDSEPEFWFPKEWRGKPVNAKQGSSGVFDKKFMVEGNKEIMDVHSSNLCHASLELYKRAVYEGVAPEQARMVLPQNTMTEWIWTGSLYAFARVCNLRLDAHAQSETQEVAKMISDIIQPLFPVSWGVLVSNN